MNEPKRDDVIAAAKAKWPNLIAVKTNHRQHRMWLRFLDKPITEISGKSWREILDKLQQA